ncbi:MAG: tRNA lysidine(34) synthetase TilS [Helicobacteraceae bacterium]|jgi:tRNA(Ile)-lysidine synthase|nr:tRNA lysidine(34) synthetase TilS [Helicobacteraceae bacterium]
MISRDLLTALKNGKNLLAFSGGVDSTALFFTLMENDAQFDCAIVNYHTRAQSDLEVSYAKELCEKYEKKLYVLDVKLSDNNFEANARKIRYAFFEQVIRENGYETLITAHQLNDWFEWFLMQTCKGAGFFELIGTRHIDDRGSYRLIRPLLSVTRDEIERYVNDRKIKTFIDRSNADRRFLRNKFRVDFAAPILDRYKEGIKRTFAALQNDYQRFQTTDSQRCVKQLTIIDKNAIDAIRKADLALKRLGILPSKSERVKMQKEESFIAARKIAICFFNGAIWIAPYEKTVMTKTFRESCRRLKIPPHIRGYIFNARIDPYSIDIFSNQNSTTGDRQNRF